MMANRALYHTILTSLVCCLAGCGEVEDFFSDEPQPVLSSSSSSEQTSSASTSSLSSTPIVLSSSSSSSSSVSRTLGCDRSTPWGQGETSKPSDTRACTSPYIGAKTSFIPGIKNRAYVANLTCAAGKDVIAAHLLDSAGKFLQAGFPRPGCPNGRYTVDFKCPSAPELEKAHGKVIVQLVKKDGSTACKAALNPNTTVRNGRLEPNAK